MMRHGLNVALAFIGAIVAIVAVVAGLAAWQLSRGPVSLDAVAPYVAAMLSRGNGLTASVDHTLLTIASDGKVAILARGVHLGQPDRGATLDLGELTLEFSPRSMLSGAIAPTRIVVSRPDLQLVRETDGSFHLGVGNLDEPASEDWGQKLLSDLVRPPDGRGALGFLGELSVQGASLVVADRSLGVEWRADSADISLTRAADRTAGNFKLTVGSGPGQATLDGDYTYLPAGDRLVVRVAFQDLRPALYATATPAVAGLAALDLPVSGEVRAVLAVAPVTLSDATWNLNFGKGVVRHPALVGGQLAIDQATLQGGYDPAAARINLGQLTVDLGRGTASVSGTIGGVGADLLVGILPTGLDADLAIGLHDIAVDDLPGLWPPSDKDWTRQWIIQHMHDGSMDDVEAQLDAHIDLSPDAPKLVVINRLDGTMKYSGLSIEYFRPLAPVRNVSGTAKFDHQEIDFTATGGTIGNIQAQTGTARFYKLDTHDEQGRIEVTAAGPFAEALSLLDTPPLLYAHDIGIDPAQATGTVTAHLVFALPLIHELNLDLVDYSADATLKDIAIGRVLFDRDLSDGALTLKLDRNAAQVDGTAKLAGAPVTLAWKQSLQAHAAVRTRYDLSTRLDDDQRAALGLDFLAGTVTGPVSVTASYSETKPHRGDVVTTIDLKDAALDVGKLSWKKPAGTAASARLTLNVVDDKPVAIRDATVTGGGMDAQFSASFDDTGLNSVLINRLVGAGSDLHASYSRDAGGAQKFMAEGKSFNAGGLLDSLDHPPPPGEASPPLTIDAKFDRLVVGPDREAKAVTATLASDGPHWRQASVDMQLSDTTKANVQFGGAAGDRKFKLTTDDFGGLLKFLGIYDRVLGGQFQLTGQAEDRDGARVLVARADGSDYRLVSAPAFARLLSLASFSGINALLSGQGIPFNRLQGDTIFAPGKITLDNMRAYGGAIGINASGTVDREASKMNVAGTLVPAYTLNSVIGNIPLLGDLLVGGAGQGVFAVNFRMDGALDDPRVSVNALSTLAPGFLRRLFFFSP
jgi:hypothetical protein